MFHNNIDNIKYINEKYSNLSNVVSGDFMYIDDKVNDNNSKEININKKWRCVEYGNKYIQMSSLGVLSYLPIKLNKEFDDKTTCIYDLVSLSNYIIYDVCYHNPSDGVCNYIRVYLSS